MMKIRRTIAPLGLAAPGMTLSTACLWPSVASAPELDEAITQTWQALSAYSQQETAEPSDPDGESRSEEEPTPTVTPTQGPPMIRVSVDTNCRSGPGLIYEYLGALMTYENAEVLASSSLSGFWVIENPDNPGTECWVGEQYATIEGDTSHLPVREPPPPPEPESGSISGMAFHDANSNGTYDSPPDVATADLTIILSEGVCPTGPAISSNSVKTDGSGRYIFPDLSPGTYCLTPLSISYFPRHEVTVSAGEHVEGIIFRQVP
jgi:hypothetical protein